MTIEQQQDCLRQWTDELRHGNRRQCDRALRRNQSFCCIGVLCDLVDPDGWSAPKREGGRWQHRLALGFTLANGQRSAAFIMEPDEFEQRTGLPVQRMYDLAEANDEGKTFTEIADMIEGYAAQA